MTTTTHMTRHRSSTLDSTARVPHIALRLAAAELDEALSHAAADVPGSGGLFFGVQQPIAPPDATHVGSLLVYCGYCEFRPGQEPPHKRVITHSRVITPADFEIRDRTPVAEQGTGQDGREEPEPADTQVPAAADAATPLSKDCTP